VVNSSGTLPRSASAYSLVSSTTTSSISSLGGGGVEGVEKHAVVVENAEQDTAWYFKYFLGKPHHNFLGQDDQKLPFVLSVLTNPEDDGSGTTHIRAILWRRSVSALQSLLIIFWLSISASFGPESGHFSLSPLRPFFPLHYVANTAS